MKKLITVLLAAAALFSYGCDGTADVKDETTPPASETTAPAVTEAPDVKLELREDQVYAADSIKDADTISIAFMGGSLTAGGVKYSSMFPGWPTSYNRWVNNVLNYFVTDNRAEGIKQQKNVRTINVGIPGTTSDYAAVRFMEQVADFCPDILFLEYSCNDLHWGGDNAALHYEYIIRRCLELDKIPVIVFIHAPLPAVEGDVNFDKYMAGIAEKDALARHYGIKTVNVYDYLVRRYENDDTTLSFMDYIGTGEGGKGYYYDSKDPTSGRYDPHPSVEGYDLYSDAFFEALESDYEGTMAKIKFADVYNVGYEWFVDCGINHVKVGDERISYEGEWNIYSENNELITDDGNIELDGAYATSENYYDFCPYPDGIAQLAHCSGASFTFTTDASAVTLRYIGSKAGLSATAYLVGEDGTDGEELGRVSMHSIYGNIDYMTDWVVLPDDGQTHTVRFVVDDPTEEKYVFRFGYIVERFDK